MKYIYIFSFGWEERFVIRSVIGRTDEGRSVPLSESVFKSLFRIPIEDIYKIVIITKRDPPDKTRKAIDMARISLREIIGLEPEVKYVDVEDFYRGVSEVKEIFNELRRELRGQCRFIVNISGGMRILCYIILSATLITGVDADFEVLREDMDKLYIFPREVFLGYDIDLKDRRILEALSEKPYTITELMEILKYSRTTIWRRIKKLTEMKLVEEENLRYKATSFAKILI